VKKTIYVMAILMLFSFCSKQQKDTIKAQGLVDGEIYSIKTKVGGTIESLYFEQGKKVKKNELLLEINTDKIMNQLEGIKIEQENLELNESKLRKKLSFINKNIVYLDKQVERLKRLHEKKAIPGDQLEQMELKLDEAKTNRHEILKNLESIKVQKDKLNNQKQYLELNLNDFSMYSPVSGYIIEKFVSMGENIFPGVPVADILDPKTLYVEVFLEEREISKLKLGQKVVLIVDGIEENIKGEIIHFGEKAEFSPKYIISEKERKSLLYEVKISVKEMLEVFKIGMPVTVVFSKQQ